MFVVDVRPLLVKFADSNATESKSQFADCCRRLQAPWTPKTESSTGPYEIESPFRRLLPEHTGLQERQHLEIDGSLRNPAPHNKNANAPLRLNAEGPFRRLVTEHISQVKMIAIILIRGKCLPCTPAPRTSMLHICTRPSVEGAFQRN